MAKVKYSAIVADISGKVGGNVFSRNASGSYVRSFKMPFNPNTGKQQAVRASFGQLISEWKSLTPAQQQLWADMAPQYPAQDRLGNSIQYTGQQLFNSLNQTLASVNIPFITSPLVPEVFSTMVIDSVDMVLSVAGDLTGTVYFNTEGGANESLVLSMTPSLSNGITKPGRSTFKKTFTAGNASLLVDYDVSAEYVALYGTPQAGAKIFVRAQLVNNSTGQSLSIGQAVTNVTQEV